MSDPIRRDDHRRDVYPHRTHPSRGLVPSVLLGVAMLFLLAACALPVASTPTEEPTPAFSPIVQHSPVVSSGQVIQQTISQFCSAVHSQNYTQAYTYLSAAFKHTVTSPSQIPNMLGEGRKVTNCEDFGNGGFLQINGTQAQDSVTWTFVLTQLGSSSQGGGTMDFVQAGTVWQIDSVTG